MDIFFDPAIHETKTFIGKSRDLTGKRFGRLKVIRPWKRSNYNGIDWLCKCKCGNPAIVVDHRLFGKRTKSCGCLQIDMFSSIIESTRQRQEKIRQMVEGV